MRRLLLLLAVILLVGCAAPGGPSAGVTLEPTRSPLPSPTPDLWFSLNVHPDGPLYVGDQVSFEILTPPGFDASGKEVEVRLGDQLIGRADFGPYGIAGREQATLWWAWDTAAVGPGDYTLSFSVLPGGPAWQQALTLLPRDEMSPAERDARWETLVTDCCTLNYISGTAAARDIAALGQTADALVERLKRQKMTGTGPEKIPIVIMSRTLGQGGFTDDAIYVSYLDRNYSGSTFGILLMHELTHWLDKGMGGDLRPTLLLEGLAVYETGGHFKPEALIPRAGALLRLDGYLPLRTLADSFYPSQHETGYLEAGALVQYMVETYGWEAFNSFYRDIHAVPGGSQAEAISQALEKHFGLTLEQLESGFLAELRSQPADERQMEDVRLSIQFYDTVRRYQQLLDPSAYFQTAWLADATLMRQKGITADYLRHPDGALNQYLEGMLVEADAALRSGDYAAADKKLQALNVMLDILERAK